MADFYLLLYSLQPEDWYSVTISDLRELGFPPVGRPALIKLLIAKYPDYQWDETKLYKGKFLQQNRLAKTVMSLFPVALSLSRSLSPLPFLSLTLMLRW